MAIISIANAESCLGRYRLTTNLHAVALGISAEEVDATVFGDTAPRRLVGMMDDAIAYDGYMDEENAGLARAAALGSQDVVFTSWPLGGVGGALTDIAYCGRAMFSEFKCDFKRGDVGRFNLSGKCSPGEKSVRGTLMHNANRTSSSNSTGVQLGAVGATQRVYAAAHVIAFGGTNPTLGVTVKNSPTQGGAYTTRLTFAQATGLTSEWVSAAGALADTWWRIDWAIGGSAGPNFTFVVAVGIQTP